MTKRIGLLLGFLLLTFSAMAVAGIIGSPASNYAVLYENGGNNTLHITNVTVNGNIGVGNPTGSSGSVGDSGPSTVNGSIDFAAGNSGQFSSCGASCVVTGGENYNVSAVTAALNMVNSLNSNLGGKPGTSVGIGTGGGQTLSIDASNGMLDAADQAEVFNVTSFNTTNSDVLTINGDAAGDNVVLNFIGLSVNFNNQVLLKGISSDQVLVNFVGGTNLSGGPTLQINDNGHNNPANIVLGVFLDPNGTVSVTNTNLGGRVFGGDSHDMQIVSGDTITSGSSPVPEPSNFMFVMIGLGLAMAWAAFRKKLA
jgi:hypothetical protein